MNYSLWTIIGFWLLLLLPKPTAADTLPIGLTINTSGANAQYALDFKSGIEAFIKSENTKSRYGKYRLELLVMEDVGKAERVYANTKRLIKHKHVLALLSDHDTHKVPEIIKITKKYNTLLLMSDNSQGAFSLNNLENIGFLSSTIDDAVTPAKPLLNSAQQIYLVSTSESGHWLKTIKDKTRVPVYGLTPEQLSLSASIENSLFIIDQNFIDAAASISTIVTEQTSPRILVLPQVDATLLINAINPQLSDVQRESIFFLSTVPLFDKKLALVKKFKQDMAALNPHAINSHRAFKGYLLANLAAESIYHSIKGVQTKSLLDVVTLPFQVLDQVVGWVKRAGSDISNNEVVETFNRMKNFNNGLQQPISINKERVILPQSWLLQVNVKGELSEADNSATGGS